MSENKQRTQYRIQCLRKIEKKMMNNKWSERNLYRPSFEKRSAIINIEILQYYKIY